MGEFFMRGRVDDVCGYSMKRLINFCSKIFGSYNVLIVAEN